jgi:hypothetical protein
MGRHEVSYAGHGNVKIEAEQEVELNPEDGLHGRKAIVASTSGVSRPVSEML